MSNMSTATDRIKKMLQTKPVHIKGAGLEETPFHRLVQEEERNKPQRKMDFILAVGRVIYLSD